MKVLLILVLILLLVLSSTAQSPWTQPANNLYGQVSVNVIPEYDLIYLKDGAEQQLARKFSDFTLQGWFEYGITEQTTLVLSVPVKILKSGESVAALGLPNTVEAGSFFAFGNVEVGIRRNIISGPWLFTAQVQFELNTSSYDQPTGLRSGYDAWSIVPMLSSGFGAENYYAYAFAAFGKRSNQYSSFLRSGVEGGYKLFPETWLALFVDWNHSLNDGSYAPESNNLLTAFYVNDQEYLSWGLKSIYSFDRDHYGIVAAIAGAFSGNLVAKSPSINLGFYYKFNSFL